MIRIRKIEKLGKVWKIGKVEKIKKVWEIRKAGKLWKGVKVLSSKFEDIFHFILRILTKLILYKKV